MGNFHPHLEARLRLRDNDMHYIHAGGIGLHSYFQPAGVCGRLNMSQNNINQNQVPVTPSLLNALINLELAQLESFAQLVPGAPPMQLLPQAIQSGGITGPMYWLRGPSQPGVGLSGLQLQAQAPIAQTQNQQSTVVSEVAAAVTAAMQPLINNDRLQNPVGFGPDDERVLIDVLKKSRAGGLNPFKAVQQLDNVSI